MREGYKRGGVKEIDIKYQKKKKRTNIQSLLGRGWFIHLLIFSGTNLGGTYCVSLTMPNIGNTSV